MSLMRVNNTTFKTKTQMQNFLPATLTSKRTIHTIFYVVEISTTNGRTDNILPVVGSIKYQHIKD